MLPLDTVVEVLVFFVLEYFAVPEREIIVAFRTPQALVALRAACCVIGGLILLIVIDIARCRRKRLFSTIYCKLRYLIFVIVFDLLFRWS